MIQNPDLRLGGFLLAAALVSFSAACSSGGGGGGDASAAATTDFLIQDAPADDLSAFEATVTELRLVDPQGATSSNLLSPSVRLEFLGLQQSSAWLASLTPPPGTWSGVQVTFAGGSVVARAADGSLVPILVAGTMLDVAFAQDLVLDAAGYQRVEIDLDLVDSLVGDVAAPPITFAPSGSVATSSGSNGLPIDEIKGVVTTVAPASSMLTIDAFVDGDLNVPLGPVDVRVTGQTLLLMENGAPFSSSGAFFSSLVSNQTFLEVHGALVAGDVTATRIEVEDQVGGGGAPNEVEIEGRVVDLDAGASTFDLLILEIEKGASIAGPVLATLGNPAVIQIAWDATTLFVEDDTNQLSSSAALRVGARVDVKLPTFVSEPFLAREVEIDDQNVEHEGFVHDVSGLPSSMIVRLENSAPAILAGLVQSTSTDVFVDTSAASFSLDVDGEPALAPAAIPTGVRVDVYGDLSGPPTAPTITASRVEIRPGRFRGVVMAANAGLSFFQAGVDSLDDPFGSNVGGGPFDVLIQPGARFDGDASSEAQFFGLFTNLSAGETLEVEVEGLGTGNANEIAAFEVDADVE